MIRFASELQPKAVLVEQVENFIRARYDENSTVIDEFRINFKKIGYTLDWKVLDASDFGVAQRRKRVFLIAFRDDTSGFDRFKFPDPSKIVKSVSQAISDLPEPVPKNELCSGIQNHIDVTPARDRERIAPVREGEWLSKTTASKNLIGSLSKKDTTKFRRLSRDEPSLTLRCGEIFFHPIENRYITPREAARIHGYDDSYVFSGPIRGRSGSVRDLDQHRQVANSVPPPLAAAVSNQIREALCL
jgi:DNA (cytosine-5)-methyltransferase 1